MGSAIGRQFSQLKKQHSQLSEQLTKTSRSAKRAEIQGILEQVAVQQQRLQEDLRTYHQSLHAITQTIHPFNITTGDWQLWQDLSTCLSSPLEQLHSLAMRYNTNKAKSALDAFTQQIPSFAQGIHAWWPWVSQALNAKTDDITLQQWVVEGLLPWTYWHQQAALTKHWELKLAYQGAASLAYDRLISHPLTQQLDAVARQQWESWADWMCTKYQRTSSAVEGRNGYLSRLHHTSGGFSAESLSVLTLIDNFDLKRGDGTTAALRLFGYYA